MEAGIPPRPDVPCCCPSSNRRMRTAAWRAARRACGGTSNNSKDTMSKSKTAYLFATQTLGKESLFMWTFTFGEVLNVKDTRKRWNHLLTLLRQRFTDLCGLRVFELHEYH